MRGAKRPAAALGLMAAAAVAVLLTPAGCSPVQWNFTFSEGAQDIPVTAAELAAGHTYTSGPYTPHTDITEDAELYVASVTLTIDAGSAAADFSEVTLIEIYLDPFGGSPSATPVATLAAPNPATDTLELDVTGVNVSDVVMDDFVVRIEISGPGATQDLLFDIEAIFEASMTL